MKKPAVKKQNVSRIELDSHLPREQFSIHFHVCSQKLRFVQFCGREVHGVSAGNDEQTSVFDSLCSEREPHGHELWALEGPVADVAVPACHAAMAGILRHDAIMMCLRELDVRAEQRLDVLSNRTRCRPLTKYSIARVRL
jgi:hypothetical protein